MKKRNTKQIILEKSLNLFSKNGYESTSVADIAQAVGIQAAALYKHYKNKQDIFDSIMREIEARYHEFANSIGIDGEDPGADFKSYRSLQGDRLVQLGTGLFSYFLHDEYMAKSRKMLTLEQYKNPDAARLYVEQYISFPIVYLSAVFRTYMEQREMRSQSERIAAMHFYGPISLMLCLCDSHPDREREALAIIKQHILQFRQLYLSEA